MWRARVATTCRLTENKRDLNENNSSLPPTNDFGFSKQIVLTNLTVIPQLIESTANMDTMECSSDLETVV